MIDILHSYEDIQKFIDDKMEKSVGEESDESGHKMDDKMSGSASTDRNDASPAGKALGPATIGSDFNADLNIN